MTRLILMMDACSTHCNVDLRARNDLESEWFYPVQGQSLYQLSCFIYNLEVAQIF
jgi:hypothetical protein